jgi:hypothetical protein
MILKKNPFCLRIDFKFYYKKWCHTSFVSHALLIYIFDTTTSYQKRWKSNIDQFRIIVYVFPTKNPIFYIYKRTRFLNLKNSLHKDQPFKIVFVKSGVFSPYISLTCDNCIIWHINMGTIKVEAILQGFEEFQN